MQLHFPVLPEELTNADQKIIEYISSHTDVFLFMTIGQLSASLGLSDATVSRFARHVGCKDFKELKHVVIQQSTEHRPVQKIAAPLLQETEFTLQNWLLRQQHCLQKTLEQLDTSEFECAIRSIQEAKCIFIYAKNASFSLGQLLFFRLRRLGLSVVLLPSGGAEVLEGLAQAGAGDLVIMFNISRVSREGNMILKYQKIAAYHTLAFTSRLYVPDKQKADIQLYVYQGEEKEYHSMSAPIAVVDGLVVALSDRMGFESAQWFDRLRNRYADIKA
ncbi:MurR/RpiR family transcriptional regulator [Lacrimispora sp.]|uniref:MurR/RpiR family transcriptional regulator n=1 Tax=Lacrimispora sp. TaxID=2719234 RepID=UPI0028549506|nr:MurR/RpiR family transcriptional regulator [Lacrimispora sp.]MDR7811457.1 MurR/RpiR family transcriptional regulator [Lacrimispora sp.]